MLKTPVPRLRCRGFLLVSVQICTSGKSGERYQATELGDSCQIVIIGDFDGLAACYIRNEVEATLNRELGSKDYGPALQKLTIIPIIISKTLGPRKERRLVQQEQKSADYRLFIDFEAFLAGDHHGRVQMLVTNVLLAVQDIDRKLKGQFAGAQLCNDIKALCPEHPITR